MGLDGTSVDYIPQTEQIQPGKVKNIGDVLADVNKGLSGIKLELPNKSLDIAETEEEKQVLELVKKVGLKKSFENNIYDKGVKIKKIQNGVFTITPNDTGNVNYFVNQKGEILFYPFGFREGVNKITTDRSYELAGVKLVDEGGKKNVIYKVVGYDEKENPIYSQNPLDINSQEYYKSWMDIEFYDSLQVKITNLKGSLNKSDKLLDVLISSGSYKIEDLELHRYLGKITEEQFDRWLPKIFEILPKQCADKRFKEVQERVPKELVGALTRIKNDELNNAIYKASYLPITEKSLRGYYERYKDKGLTQDIVLECYRNLQKNK